MQTGFIENVPIASFPCIRRSGVSLTTLIADTRKAVAGDAGNAQAVFSAHGTLVGVTEVDIRIVARTLAAAELALPELHATRSAWNLPERIPPVTGAGPGGATVVESARAGN